VSRHCVIFESSQGGLSRLPVFRGAQFGGPDGRQRSLADFRLARTS